MIQSSLAVAEKFAAGRLPQVALELQLLQGTVLIAMDGVTFSTDTLQRYDGVVVYDGDLTFGATNTGLYGVINVSAIDEGEQGAPTTLSVIETRRSTFT